MKTLHYIFARRLIAVSSLAVGCFGCHEPNYRAEVTSNGQGSMELHRVPKDPAETSTPVPSHASGARPVAAPGASIDRRIEELEAQVTRLNEEITKLKLEKAAGGSP